MTEEKKPFVHELKARDFFLDPPEDTMSGARLRHSPPWRLMETMPRDRTVEVMCVDDSVHIVAWVEGRIVGDGYPGGARYWRERS